VVVGREHETNANLRDAIRDGRRAGSPGKARRMIPSLQLFWIMLKGALLSTSGTGNLPIVHQDLVSRGWAQEHQFAEALAIGQISPGPTGFWVISLGYLVGGFRGAAITLAAISIPPVVVLVLVRKIYRRWGNLPVTEGFVRGLSIGVNGVFLIVLVRIMSSAGWTPQGMVIAAATAAAGATHRIPVVFILLAAAITGMAVFSGAN